MSEPLTDDVLAAMIARDDAAGDGVSTPDDLVFTDRHLLLVEVRRQRDLISSLQQGHPSATGSVI